MPGQSLSKFAGNAAASFVDDRPGCHENRTKLDGPSPPGRVTGFACIRCGVSYPSSLIIDSRGCPACQEVAPANLKPVYAAPVDPSRVAAGPPHSLWRYAHALPCAADDAVSLGEGQTPLVDARRVGRMLGVPNLFIKDEGRNPTWSHKDRFSTVAVSVARAQGARVVATASSGNAGASLAAYAARAGLDCVVTTFPGAAGAMVSQIRKYGATVLPLRNKIDRWTLLAEAAARYGWFVASPFHAPVVGSHPLGIEGYKTIAYELVEQLGGTAPNWCVLPVCYGDALAGVWAGFQELAARGIVSTLPKMVAAEVHGSLTNALDTGRDRLEEQEPAFESLAGSIGAPRSTYQALRVLRDSSGCAVAISNEELVDMQEQLAAHEGVFAELASVTPLLAIARLRREGVIAKDDSVIAVVTASGLKDLDRSISQPANAAIFPSTNDAMKWLAERRAELLVGGTNSGH